MALGRDIERLDTDQCGSADGVLGTWSVSHRSKRRTTGVDARRRACSGQTLEQIGGYALVVLSMSTMPQTTINLCFKDRLRFVFKFRF